MSYKNSTSSDGYGSDGPEEVPGSGHNASRNTEIATGLLIDIEETESELQIEPQQVKNPTRNYADFENEQVVLVIPPALKINKAITPPPQNNNEIPPPPPTINNEIPPPPPTINNVIPPPPPRTNPLPTQNNNVIVIPPPAPTINNVVAPLSPDKATPKARDLKSNSPPCKIKSCDALPPHTIYDSVKPDIIIGEIDRDEATFFYENLLGIGKRIVDWLGADVHISFKSDPTSQRLNSCPTELHAFQRQIVSIETEYNRLRRDMRQQRNCPAKTDLPLYYKPEEQIKPEDIKPKVFSSEAPTAANLPGKSKIPISLHTKDDEVPCSSTQTQTHKPVKPKSPGPSCCTCSRDTRVLKTCSFCIEDRLKNLELSFRNHEGNFTHVVAELKACLEYCNSYSDDSSNEELRNRITALYKIVELHKAALEDWKQELKQKIDANK